MNSTADAAELFLAARGLAILAEGNNTADRRAALAHPALSLSAMDAFLDLLPLGRATRTGQADEEALIGDAVALVSNPSVTAGMIARLSNSPFFDLHFFTLTGDYHSDPRWSVMRGILGHRFCPAALVAWAVCDGRPVIGWAVARNPLLSVAQVRILLGLSGVVPPLTSESTPDGQKRMILVLRNNKVLPADLLFNLMPEMELNTVMFLASFFRGGRREACVAQVLSRRVGRIDRAWAAQRTTSLHNLEELALDDEPNVREGVARNPAATADLVSALCADPSPEVRAIAAEHPRASEADRVFVALNPAPRFDHPWLWVSA